MSDGTSDSISSSLLKLDVDRLSLDIAEFGEGIRCSCFGMVYHKAWQRGELHTSVRFNRFIVEVSGVYDGVEPRAVFKQFGRLKAI